MPSEAERLLGEMDDIYAILVTMDYPDAITGGLRRLTDVARGIIERTRGDLTLSLRQERLENSIRELETRLDGLQPVRMKIIRASEIGTYQFCNRAWWYQLQGYEPENKAELAAGTEIHEKHSRAGADQPVACRVMAYAFLLLAIIDCHRLDHAGNPVGINRCDRWVNV